ncbi:hypothetical protein [Thalassobacillus cyri]|uniref:hypothetical protein n=1 Tax=Thalassobacillus cyri TaxID=571932 RepID=UPI000B840CA9|nr:hypothetical protein [Thalassobacillus cyri]
MRVVLKSLISSQLWITVADFFSTKKTLGRNVGALGQNIASLSRNIAALRQNFLALGQKVTALGKKIIVLRWFTVYHGGSMEKIG